MQPDDALRFEQVDVMYRVGAHEYRALRDLNFVIRSGRTYGLVGESGCGKSTAALAAVRYLARNGRVSAGRILVAGRDLMALSPPELQQLRRRSVSMVYQDPARALNPTLRIGRQMAEVFEVSGGLKGKAAQERVAAMLERVQIANPRRVMSNYPHQLSGGMQQRIVIAMALSKHPALLILDEPTTGLDATVEAEVLDLIARLRDEFSTSILFISHNLAVINRMCDQVGVLYAGELVEEGSNAEVFGDPRHPYTVALLRCLPHFGRRKTQGPLETIPGFPPAIGAGSGRCVFVERCANATDRCQAEVPPALDLGGRLTRCFYPERAPDLPHTAQAGVRAAPAVQAHQSADEPLLRARNLSKSYVFGGRSLRVLHEVSLELRAGETLGLVGESGSGKSSLAALLLGLSAPDAGGDIELDGQPLKPLTNERTPAQRQALQIVFQNPGSALNRSQTVRTLLQRSLRLLRLSPVRREQRLKKLVSAVRLPEQHLRDRPKRLSGGQQQRVSIARAFAGAPRIVVCDEPTSALDVSVQSAILNLLLALQSEQQVSYLFISHDLNVVNFLADRIAVLYLGRLMEIGPSEAIFAGPQHPYTEALLSANPDAHAQGERVRLQGELPSALDLPRGCVFHTRCPRKIGRVCEECEPPLLAASDGHAMRCHIPPEELARLQSGRVS
ncbi:MAG TPA: ABC transporter ATP-binding protein [Steroidobacteraceae bacterium]